MSKEYAKDFYNSTEWRKTSTLYMTSKNYVCERCGKPGVICHHKKYITPSNIDNMSITLNPDNLECLCAECHNLEHKPKHNVTYFDEEGNVQRVKEAGDLSDFKRSKSLIDDLIERAKTAFNV